MLKEHTTEGKSEHIVLQDGKLQLHIWRTGKSEEFSLRYADGSFAITRSHPDNYPTAALRCDLRKHRFAEVATGLGRVTHELCAKYAGKDGFQRPLVIEPAPYPRVARLLVEAEDYLLPKSQPRRRALLERCRTYMDSSLVELLSVPVERTPFPKYRHSADVLLEWFGPQCYLPQRRNTYLAAEQKILRPGGTLLVQNVGVRRAK